jgi:hypothetical protein
MEETISLDDGKVILKRYKLHRTGAQKATIEISLPKDAVEREGRALGVSEQEAAEKLIGIWRYDGFHGLHLNFELRQGVLPQG